MQATFAVELYFPFGRPENEHGAVFYKLSIGRPSVDSWAFLAGQSVPLLARLSGPLLISYTSLLPPKAIKMLSDRPATFIRSG
jgi:hypothetical protein